MTLDARRLRVLVALAEERSFTDAAIALGTTQASVSRGLASLEQELGVRLFERTTRSVTLTAAGTRVLVRARAALTELEAVARAATGDAGEVRLGFAWAALGRHTAEVQRLWRLQHSEVELVLVHADTRTAGLLDGRADVAILRQPVEDRRLQGVVVGLESRFAAMASGHPLARKRSIRMDDFDGCTIAIDLVTGTTSEALWPEGAGPASTHPIRGMEEWLTVIGGGRVLGMTSAATAWQHPRPGIAYRAVRDVPPVAVTLAWRAADPPPLAQALARLVAGVYAG